MKSRLTHLKPADREKIVQFRDDGMTIAAIAKRFGVSIATISRALDKRTTLIGSKFNLPPIKISTGGLPQRRSPQILAVVSIASVTIPFP
jgi:IS30 family transposase